VGRPRRTVPGRPTRRSLLVFAEGEVTEERYINLYRRRHRRDVTVTVAEFHGTPLALVERAAEAGRREAHEERRGRRWAPDEVWCVFDVDEHPGLAEARELAASEDIRLAISNPCIELFFALHFVEQDAHLGRHAARRLAEEHLACGKALTEQALEALAANYETARERAIALEAGHRRDGTPEPANPSSDLWRLIDSIAGV
jgi:RloB-like protein